MKKTTIILIVIAVAVVGLIGLGVGRYNKMTPMLKGVEKTWADVETQYQRRADLIPNLVETVKGYAAHESTTLQNVTEARAKVGTLQLSVDQLDEETLKKYAEAQNELTAAMKSLLAVSEAYPDLKANENFLRFQDEYTGTENRIQFARSKYNESVREYDTYISLFPNNIFASFFGFKEKPYYSADAGASQAPQVKF